MIARIYLTITVKANKSLSKFNLLRVPPIPLILATPQLRSRLMTQMIRSWGSTRTHAPHPYVGYTRILKPVIDANPSTGGWRSNLF